jgi:hypothetical protein
VNVPILTENHGCPRFESGSRHLRNANLQVKRLRTWIGTSSFTGAHTTTSFTGGARRRSTQGKPAAGSVLAPAPRIARRSRTRPNEGEGARTAGCSAARGAEQARMHRNNRSPDGNS